MATPDASAARKPSRKLKAFKAPTPLAEASIGVLLFPADNLRFGATRVITVPEKPMANLDCDSGDFYIFSHGRL
jgi:hypothetical protein